MPIELCYAQSAHALCSACCPLSPLRGRGAQQKKKKKKKKVRGNECALGPFESSWSFNVSVKEHTHSLLGLVPTPMLPKKKKKTGG